MVLPFETASAEDRRVERERQRRLVFALSRSDPTADCLAAMATNLLDHQFRLEDAVLVAAADAPPPADRLRRLLSLSLALPQATLNLTVLFYLFYHSFILFVFALPFAGSAVFALPFAGSAVCALPFAGSAVFALPFSGSALYSCRFVRHSLCGLCLLYFALLQA